MSINCQRVRRILLQARCLRNTRHQLRPTIIANYNLTMTNNFHTSLPHFQSDEEMTRILDKEEETLNRLLDATLEEVLVHGWSMSAVSAACQKLGHPAVTAGLVDNVAQLVLLHINTSNRKLDSWMVEEVARLTQGGQRLRIGQFVRSCIVQRLSMNAPFIRAGLWSEGVAMLCQSIEGVAAGVGAWQVNTRF